MVFVKDITQCLEEWAPLQLAENYDNVGLLVGSLEAEVQSAILSIDCTLEVVQEAIDKNCQLIISHHPILFHGLKRLTGSTQVERALMLAIKHDIALYAIHTNLDNVSQGVNAKIADMLGLTHQRVLAPALGRMEKIVVFVPAAHEEQVRSAAFSAGAGKLGFYEECSFSGSGSGTYKATAGAAPFAGEVGQRHSEQELRLEMLLHPHQREAVVKAICAAHPYEEVAYYLHPLSNAHPYIGAGMVGNLSETLPFDTFLDHVKTALQLPLIRHTPELERPVSRVALCGGSGSAFLQQAIAAGADAYISSDFKYHQFFEAEGKITILDIGHYESEQFTVNLLAEKLQEKNLNFALHFTEVNTNPLSYY